MGLPKANRLKHRQDFKSVYESGLTLKSAHLVMRALTQSSSPRFGIVVSQKVSKKAVERNRIKRLVRNALRQFLPQVREGWQVIIIARSSAVECKSEHFLRELEQLLLEAEIIHGN